MDLVCRFFVLPYEIIKMIRMEWTHRLLVLPHEKDSTPNMTVCRNTIHKRTYFNALKTSIEDTQLWNCFVQFREKEAGGDGGRNQVDVHKST